MLMLSAQNSATSPSEDLKSLEHDSFLVRASGAMLGLALTACLVSCGGGGDSSGPTTQVSASTVQTSSGAFQGLASPSGRGTEFRGIRYASAARWRPPQMPTPTTTSKVADTFGAVCPSVGSANESEDCLFLNIYVPTNVTVDSHTPVLLFMHGGGFVSGSGQIYSATNLSADNNIIVVTINYRLGALGWLSDSKLAATAASDFENVGDAGNYGLMDLQFALRWVRDNISGFGGDPSKVTVSGESAGGMSVAATLTSTTTAAGLFRAAIIQSGEYYYYTTPSAASRQSTVGAAFNTDLGCDSADCLRSKTVAQVLASQARVFGRYNFGPVYGTKIVAESPKSAFEAGRFIKVPVMQGVTANEGRFFLSRLLTPLPAQNLMLATGGPASYDLQQPNSVCGSACTYSQLVNRIVGRSTPDAIDSPYLRIIDPSAITPSLLNTLAALYPASAFQNSFLNNAPSADMALSQMWGDASIVCPSRAADAALSRYVSVYAFEFDDPAAPPTSNTVGFPLGSQHTAELNYLYDLGATLNADQQQLALAMRRYWGNFVTNLDPNALALPTFKTFPAVQRFTPGANQIQSTSDFDQRHFCSSTWDPIRTAN